MATKRGKSSASKKSATRPSRAARRPAASAPARSPAGKTAPKPAPPRAAPRKPAAASSAPAAAARAAAPADRAPAGAGLLESAERLRDEIQRSKLTHPDPWAFASKARAWEQRAQALVERIAAGGDATASRRAVEALAAEITGDRDFQEARRLF